MKTTLEQRILIEKMAEQGTAVTIIAERLSLEVNKVYLLVSKMIGKDPVTNAILDHWLDGNTLDDTAETFAITRQRVFQITQYARQFGRLQRKPEVISGQAL